MARLRTLGLGWVLSIGLAAVTPGLSARTVRSAQGSIVINEVQANPTGTGTESDFEWVELFNPGPEGVALGGWRLSDARAMTVLPEVDIPSGGYIVVAGPHFDERFPNAPGGRVTVPRIGNGLGNSGDELKLADAAGQVVDALSWGDNSSVFDPPIPAAPGGSSLERVPAGRDTNVAGDWIVQATPSPGAPAAVSSPQATSTVGAPTQAVPAEVTLNEVLAAPHGVDWDGDGTANGDDEWVEVFNAGPADLDLRGWLLDDVADGGSSAYRIPDAAVVPARGHRVFFKKETGLSLNNGGDSVRLLRADGAVADAVEIGASGADIAWGREPDGTGGWTDRFNPSPGQANGATGARATPIASPETTPSPPAKPSAKPTATPTGALVGTPTPPDGSPTPGSDGTVFLPFLISEVMFDPDPTGNDAASEWVELHNRTAVAASLAGWAVGDRGAWDVLPAVDVPPGGFAVVAGPEAQLRPADAVSGPIIRIADGRIGGGLGNTGDVVRLRGPDAALVDAVSYGANLDAFDPSVPIGVAGTSIERLPADQDTDSAADWRLQPDPSPGRAGDRHDAPPAVALNEVLPAPALVDWDADGESNHTDEWVELYNGASYAVHLKGWKLADAGAERRGWAYRFDERATIPAHGFLVLYRAASGIALDNGTDALRLIRPDGTEADRFLWPSSPGYDRSWSRLPDGIGEWSSALAVTPGQPNRPLAPGERHAGDVAHARALAERSARRGAARSSGRGSAARAPAPPQPATIAELRAMRRGTRVVIHGRVTAAPEVLGVRTFYLGDETGGVRVYLAPRDRALKAFGVGEPVSAIGRLADYRGERQLVLARTEDAWWDGVGGAVPPFDAPSGDVGETTEGRLVRVRGRVAAVRATGITLDDGSGPLRVVLLRSAAIGAPAVSRGQWATVVGIAGQSAARAPWEGGYRLMPRGADDVAATMAHDAGAKRGAPRGGAKMPLVKRPFLAPSFVLSAAWPWPPAVCSAGATSAN
ncbi:MAG: lamin tail domain-containing protein [Ardenticatenales bacterium]